MCPFMVSINMIPKAGRIYGQMCPFMLSINMIPTLVAYTVQMCPFMLSINICDQRRYRIFIDNMKGHIHVTDADAGRIYDQMCPFMLSINMIPTLVAYTVKCALSCYR